MQETILAELTLLQNQFFDYVTFCSRDRGVPKRNSAPADGIRPRLHSEHAQLQLGHGRDSFASQASWRAARQWLATGRPIDSQLLTTSDNFKEEDVSTCEIQPEAATLTDSEADQVQAILGRDSMHSGQSPMSGTLGRRQSHISDRCRPRGRQTVCLEDRPVQFLTNTPNPAKSVVPRRAIVRDAADKGHSGKWRFSAFSFRRAAVGPSSK